MVHPYLADQNRYKNGMQYNRCGKSGLKLPALSLGLWHNFGGINTFENSRSMVRRAFDLGITHFDLANNYGPPPGSAESFFGQIMQNDFAPYRDELIISTKAGHEMWPGPYGEWGSRKYLLASLDQSLKRMKLDYVDIFYSHRFDPQTPLEETMDALAQAVRQGKALYVGISMYQPDQSREAIRILKDKGIHCLIHQPVYSLLNRWIEPNLQSVLTEEGVGSIAFCPLAQGHLTSKYLTGIPDGSRAHRLAHLAKGLTPELVTKLHALNELAQRRDQTLAQMSLSWVLREGKITSALIGASKVEQIEENVKCLEKPHFTPEEMQEIETILAS